MPAPSHDPAWAAAVAQAPDLALLNVVDQALADQSALLEQSGRALRAVTGAEDLAQVLVTQHEVQARQCALARELGRLLAERRNSDSERKPR